MVTWNFTLHLRTYDHTTWFWRCLGTVFGHFSFGLSQLHGHGSWLVCEVATKGHFIYKIEDMCRKGWDRPSSLHIKTWRPNTQRNFDGWKDRMDSSTTYYKYRFMIYRNLHKAHLQEVGITQHPVDHVTSMNFGWESGVFTTTRSWPLAHV